MNVPFSLLLAAGWAIHPGRVAARNGIYPDIARKSVSYASGSSVAISQT